MKRQNVAVHARFFRLMSGNSPPGFARRCRLLNAWQRGKRASLQPWRHARLRPSSCPDLRGAMPETGA